MIYVKEDRYVPASKLQLGDILVSAKYGYEITVDSIDEKISKGVYAPLTPSGTIIVNGILASSYVSLQKNSSMLMIGGVSTNLSFHWLIHTLNFLTDSVVIILESVSV